jgi:hypothetical protein
MNATSPVGNNLQMKNGEEQIFTSACKFSADFAS